jgi:hypothetical protein
MNKILKKLITICVVVLTCSVAFAQEQQAPTPTAPGVVALPLVMPCNRSKQIFDLLGSENYKESPIALGEANIYKPDNTPVRGQLTLWYNTQGKKNFSIVFTIKNTDITCILSSGVNMELIPAMFGDAI